MMVFEVLGLSEEEARASEKQAEALLNQMASLIEGHMKVVAIDALMGCLWRVMRSLPEDNREALIQGVILMLRDPGRPT